MPRKPSPRLTIRTKNKKETNNRSQSRYSREAIADIRSRAKRGRGTEEEQRSEYSGRESSRESIRESGRASTSRDSRSGARTGAGTRTGGRSESANQSRARSNRSTGRSTDRSTGRSTERGTDRSTDRGTDRNTDRMADQRSEGLRRRGKENRADSRSADTTWRSKDQSSSRSTGSTRFKRDSGSTRRAPQRNEAGSRNTDRATSSRNTDRATSSRSTDRASSSRNTDRVTSSRSTTRATTPRSAEQASAPRTAARATPARLRTSQAGAEVSHTSDLRLNKFLADAGIASRRAADELIDAGVVKVNGRVVTEQGTKVHPADLVTVRGEPVSYIKHLTYLVLNKPKDYITTTSDEKGRKTVMDLIPLKQRLYPVGRLDRNTTGALIITNDGELATRLMHPKYEIEREYVVGLDKRLTTEHAKSVANGVTLDDGTTGPAEVLINPEDRTEVRIILREGKNREVRRIFEHFGYEVVRLHRVRYAHVTVSGLSRGEYRHLSRDEVRALRKRVGVE
ncbi:MAG: pseudouridine synthase [Candidatus Kapaibacterium sp.]|jgi:23S rRNA pseudouridine2605 synthase